MFHLRHYVLANIFVVFRGGYGRETFTVSECHLLINSSQCIHSCFGQLFLVYHKKRKKNTYINLLLGERFVLFFSGSLWPWNVHKFQFENLLKTWTTKQHSHSLSLSLSQSPSLNLCRCGWSICMLTQILILRIRRVARFRMPSVRISDIYDARSQNHIHIDTRTHTHTQTKSPADTRNTLNSKKKEKRPTHK